MKIRQKIVAIFFLAMLIITAAFIANLIIVNSLIGNGREVIMSDVNKSIEQSTHNQLVNLGQTAAEYELSFEAEVDKNMLNAAKLLYEKDADSCFSLRY